MTDKSKKEGGRRFPALVIISIAVLISFMLSFFLGQSGIFHLQQLKSEYDRLILENHKLAMENKRIAEEIKKLRQDPATVEKIAREELHYVSPHDTVLIVPGSLQ